jgi:3-hydroxybutyryl-CoA dehydratase
VLHFKRKLTKDIGVNKSMAYKDYIIGYKGLFKKKVTERDNLLFADISGDYNKLHFDDSTAIKCGFKGKISNGFVTESRIAAALVETFGSEDSFVLALEKNTKFLRPVYIDDDITATVKVVGRLEKMNLLKIEAKCFDQNNELVVKTKMLIKIISIK